MGDSKTILWWVAIGLHCLAAGALVLLVFQTRAMAVFCIVPGALIGAASVPAVRGRPISLYAAFGVLMGYSFWALASAVNQREPILGLLALLVAAGAVWLLKAPGWPSVIFSGVAILLCLGLVALNYRWARDLRDSDLEHTRKSAITTFGFLTLGLAYAGIGFAEVSQKDDRGAARGRRKKRRRPREEEEV
jgi:hypothetical protein